MCWFRRPTETNFAAASLLRRVHKQQLTPVMTFEFGNVSADFSSGAFFKNKKPLSLTAKEAELLRLLVNHRGQILPREKILAQVWRESPHITPRTVDVHIAWLRQKIEDQPAAPSHIVTVRGEGYRFDK